MRGHGRSHSAITLGHHEQHHAGAAARAHSLAEHLASVWRYALALCVPWYSYVCVPIPPMRDPALCALSTRHSVNSVT